MIWLGELNGKGDAMAGGSVLAMTVSCPTFLRKRRRVWHASISLTFFLHGVFFFALLYGVISHALGLTTELGGAVLSREKNPPKISPFLEFAELPLPSLTVAPGTAASTTPAGLDPILYRRLLALGITKVDRSPADLARLTKQAEKISDSSLDAIGQFLGQKKGTYVPRTYYRDELNPNASFLSAKIVAAKTLSSRSGETGFLITLEDAEQDRFIFTLLGKPAKVLAAAGPCFSGTPLGTIVSGKRFELKGARIQDLRRWKPPLPKRGTLGTVVFWVDPNGVELVLHLPKKRYRAFWKNVYYFARRRRGFTPDESTIFNEKFDNSTAVLYKCDDLTVPGGVPTARLVYIDVRGERMISILHGDNALRQLENLRPLQNPVLQNIWQRAGLQMFSGLQTRSRAKKKIPSPKNFPTKKKIDSRKSKLPAKSPSGRETRRVPEKD